MADPDADHDDYPPLVVDGNDDVWWQGQCSECSWLSYTYDTYEAAYTQASAHVRRDHGIQAWVHDIRGFTWQRPTKWHPESNQPTNWSRPHLLRSRPKKKRQSATPSPRSWLGMSRGAWRGSKRPSGEPS